MLFLAPARAWEPGPVAVVPSGAMDSLLAQRLVDMTTSLLGELKRFDVVERARLEEVMKEQELWASGVVSDSEAVAVGKLLGARTACVISPEGFSRGPYAEIAVSLRFVDVEDGTLRQVVRGRGSGSDETSALGALREDLRGELIEAFRTRGIVDEVEPGGAFCAISVGRDEGAQPGVFYKVLRGERIKHDAGLLRVEETFPDYSVARVITGGVARGDTVLEASSPKRGDLSAYYIYLPMDSLGGKGFGIRALWDEDCNFFGPDLRVFGLSWGSAKAYGVSVGAFKGAVLGDGVMLYVRAIAPGAVASQRWEGRTYFNILYGFDGALGLDLWFGNLYAFAEAGGIYLTPFSRWDAPGDSLPGGNMELTTPVLSTGFGVRF